jgi:putative addiction module component (TIGR02574 family)
MSEHAERFKAELTTLSLDDRAEIAEFLIDSLDREMPQDKDPALDAELRRRLAEIESGQAKGKPAEQVFAELRARFS